MKLSKIVSGGQTGVDRGALDAALAHDFPSGGWCPSGRQAEDGPIDTRYPLVEMAHGGYVERTLQNVLDSDATLVIHHGTLEGGTGMTVRFCEQHHKPYALIDAATVDAEHAVGRVADFVERHGVATLNVAGPRASKWADARAWTRRLVGSLLARADG